MRTLLLGLVFASATCPVQAQLKVSETGDSSLELIAQVYHDNLLDLIVSITQSGVSTLMLDGVAQVGRHESDSIHRNSFWVDLDLKNATGVDLSGIEFSLTATDGGQDPLDGLSFGALSATRQTEVIEQREEFGASERNLWGFTAAIIRADGHARSLDQIEYPFPASLNDPTRFHKFRVSDATIRDGEEVLVRFLVTQNGPADRAYVQFNLVAVPEPRLTGFVLACVAGMGAVLHSRRRRRARSAS